MQLGIADHIWSIGELIEGALMPEISGLTGGRVGGLTVISGGKAN
jgi:hypothetical protein